MGPAKRAKAEKLGVKIIDEAQFLEMIADTTLSTSSDGTLASEDLQQNVKFFEKDAVQGSLF
jgi:BRCT domain type II-containing protein